MPVLGAVRDGEDTPWRRGDDVRSSATSANGAVTVTIDASGVLVGAEFADRVLSTSSDELGRQLLMAVNQAEAEVAGRVREQQPPPGRADDDEGCGRVCR